MLGIESRPARPVKDYWFTRGLQQLSPEKFLKVVGKILAGEYVLLRFPSAPAFDLQSETRNGRPGISETSNGRIE